MSPPSPKSSSDLGQLRQALIGSGISDVARSPATPPNSPASTPRRLSLAEDRSEPASSIPRAPTPPPMPAVVMTPASASVETPAQVLAKPMHVGKSVAEKMKLFVPASLKGAMDRLASGPTTGPILAELARNPPDNLKDVLCQLGTIDNFTQDQNAQQIATRFKSGGGAMAELAAAKMASYKAHAHDYMGDPTRSSPVEMAGRLVAQMGRDVELIGAFFAEATRGGDLGAFYRSFTPAADASCHAVRMNALTIGFEGLREAQAQRAVGPEVAILTNPAKGHKDSDVLQAAYKLAGPDPETSMVTPEGVRGALGRIGVPVDRANLIVAGLQAAFLCEE